MVTRIDTIADLEPAARGTAGLRWAGSRQSPDQSRSIARACSWGGREMVIVMVACPAAARRLVGPVMVRAVSGTSPFWEASSKESSDWVGSGVLEAAVG